MISCNLAIRTQKQELGVICNSAKASAQCLAEIKEANRSKIFILLHASPLFILFSKYLLLATLPEQALRVSLISSLTQ